MSEVPEPIRVFVDAHPLDIRPGATALDAVRVYNAALATDVEASLRVITDSRGLPIANDTPMVPGFILRVIAHRIRHDPDLPDDPT